MREFCLPLLLVSCAALAEAPAYVIELPDSVEDVFIADAASATLHRFRHADGELTRAEDTYMSIGQRGVGKERAWDRRTPLGVYFVVDQLDTSRLHEKYGITAFPLDYPNEWDRLNDRTGDGIWVHGVLPGGGRRPPLDTDGCLALPNEDLAALQSSFVPLVTPVIVTRQVEWIGEDRRDELREELRSAVDRWAASIAAGDLHAYLSLYSEDFSYRGVRLSEWAALRLTSFERAGAVEVTIDDLALLADPEEDALYVSRFRQTTTEAGSDPVVRVKRLYWQRQDDGELRIIAEDNG